MSAFQNLYPKFQTLSVIDSLSPSQIDSSDVIFLRLDKATVFTGWVTGTSESMKFFTIWCASSLISSRKLVVYWNYWKTQLEYKHVPVLWARFWWEVNYRSQFIQPSLRLNSADKHHSCVQTASEDTAEPVLWLQLRTLALESFQSAASHSPAPKWKTNAACPILICFFVHTSDMRRKIGHGILQMELIKYIIWAH